MSDPRLNEVPPSSPSRLRTVVFYLSLGLNLVVLGVVIGSFLGPGRTGPRVAVEGQTPLFRALAPEDRAALRGEIRQARSAEGPDGRGTAIRRTRELLRILRADMFDAAGFAALLEAQQAAYSERAASGRAALVRLLAGMDLQERRVYADQLEAELRKAVRDRAAAPNRSGTR